MVLSTRQDIRREALRRAGGFVEDLTGTPNTTTAAAAAMAYRFDGDDDEGKGLGLYEPSSAAADRLRVATSWDDSAGQATVDTLSVAWSAADTVEYYLRNDPKPYEWDDALNDVMHDTRRIVESWIPTVEGGRDFGLLNMPWIEKRDDIVRVELRASPNVLDNSNFELFGRGSDAQLQAWVLSGTSATVTRVDGLYQRFAARITRSSNDVTLEQEVPIPILQLQGGSISVFGRVKTNGANFAKIRISDGTDTTDTSFHTGGGGWEELEATHTVNASAVGPLKIQLLGLTSDTNADFENAVAVKGTLVPEWLEKYGDQHAVRQPILATKQMTGSIPTIVTDRLVNAGNQLVVTSRQRYFDLTADSGTGGVTDMPFECAVTGLLTKLAKRQIGKPNFARWNVIGGDAAPDYAKWRKHLAEPSKQATPSRLILRSR